MKRYINENKVILFANELKCLYSILTKSGKANINIESNKKECININSICRYHKCHKYTVPQRNYIHVI